MKCAIILLAFGCLFAGSYGETKFDKIYRNARFQYKLAYVALHNQVFGATGVELGLAKTDEERDCITNAKKAAIEDGDRLLGETVGKIVPPMDKLYESGTEEEKSAYVDKFDYEEFKKSAMEDFKKKLMKWVPAQQEKMASCRK
uniref:Heteropteran venom family 1 protein 2 n=1 Tax=Oncocephalus sp. TaxID=2944721 RepID=A0AB38ZEG5_9HEMI